MKGSGLAWTAYIILNIIGIIIGIFATMTDPVSISTIIINVLILYYVFRPSVKAWFGKT